MQYSKGLQSAYLKTRHVSVSCLQVYKVFAALCPPLGLSVGLAAGKAPVSSEVAALTQHKAGRACCAVDIMVATPGRLMSHLTGTDGITLDRLQFLVRHYVQYRLALAEAFAGPCA